MDVHSVTDEQLVNELEAIRKEQGKLVDYFVIQSLAPDGWVHPNTYKRWLKGFPIQVAHKKLACMYIKAYKEKGGDRGNGKTGND